MGWVAEEDPKNFVWVGSADFGTGVHDYRCRDISTKIGQSDFEYLNPRLGWRPVRNYDVRRAMHSFISENVRDPF
jgi:hypothetical protein